MPDTATLEARLAEAEAALHRLLISRQTVQLRRADGSQVEYTAASADSLRGYIAELKSQLGRRSRRAIAFRF